MVCVLVSLSLVAPMLTSREVESESPKERYESLLKEYKSAAEAWSNRYEPGGKPTPKSEIEARYRDWPVWSFLPRFLRLAEESPEDAAAADALFWIIDQGTAVGLCDRGYYPYLERALDLLAQRDLLQDKRLLQGFRYVISHSSPATEKFLRIALENAKDREVRGRACLALGNLLTNRAEFARDPWFDKPSKTLFESFLAGRHHPGVVEYIRETDREASTAEGEKMFERAIDEFGDVVYAPRRNPDGRDTTVADSARFKLDEIRHLAIGQVGPEIEGMDVDGKPLKLSDYRGKVVVLSFWGSWCGPCMALVPHERELAARLADKPFALLGVNSDEDREQARKVMDRERMPWRSWWDGKPPGPIAERWHAGPWPTLYVLDAEGVIRYKGHGEEGLDEAIDAALKGMQGAAKR